MILSLVFLVMYITQPTTRSKFVRFTTRLVSVQQEITLIKLQILNELYIIKVFTPKVNITTLSVDGGHDNHISKSNSTSYIYIRHQSADSGVRRSKVRDCTKRSNLFTFSPIISYPPLILPFFRVLFIVFPSVSITTQPLGSK